MGFFMGAWGQNWLELILPDFRGFDSLSLPTPAQPDYGSKLIVSVQLSNTLKEQVKCLSPIGWRIDDAFELLL